MTMLPNDDVLRDVFEDPVTKWLRENLSPEDMRRVGQDPIVTSGRGGYGEFEAPSALSNDDGKSGAKAYTPTPEIPEKKYDPIRQYEDILEQAQADYEIAKGIYRDDEGKLKDTSGWKGNLAYGAENAPMVGNEIMISGQGNLGTVAGTNLGRALAGALGGFVNPTADEAQAETQGIADAQGKLDRATKAVADAIAREEAKARTGNYQSLDEERKAKATAREKENEEKTRKNQQLEQDKRIGVLASIYNKSTSFDPNGSVAKEFERLTGVKLAPKSGNAKMIQDKGTGEWYYYRDNENGESVRAEYVSAPDGKPLVTTSDLDVSRSKAEMKQAFDLEKLQFNANQDMRLKVLGIEANKESTARDVFVELYTEKKATGSSEEEAIEYALEVVERATQAIKKTGQ